MGMLMVMDTRLAVGHFVGMALAEAEGLLARTPLMLVSVVGMLRRWGSGGFFVAMLQAVEVLLLGSWSCPSAAEPRRRQPARLC